jgi:2-iminobutanoate/2-iminopropanoate deaminase
MKNTIRDIRVAKQIGKDSDAVEAPAGGRTLFLSGTPGLTKDGHLPASFEEQAEQARAGLEEDVVALLEEAGMGLGDLVKVSQYLTRAEDIARYPPIRAKWLSDHRPASMLLVFRRWCVQSS